MEGTASALSARVFRLDWFRTVSFLFYLLLLVPILLAKQHPTWDEPYQLDTLEKLHQHGLGSEFLRSMVVAMGPVYALFLSLWEPALGPSLLLGARVLNWLLLGVVVWTSAGILKSWGHQDPSKAWMVLGIPLLPMMSGFMMTDIPIIAVLMVSLLILSNTYFATVARSHRMNMSSVFASVSGWVLALAICGRQTYLTVLGGIPFLMARAPRFRLPLTCYGLAALSLPIPLFLAWGGFTSPWIQHQETSAQLTSHSTHLLLAVSQTAIFLLLFTSEFVTSHPKRSLAVVTGFLLAIPLIEYALVPDLVLRLPLRYAFQRLFGTLEPFAARGMLSLSFGLGLLLVWHVVEQIRAAAPFQAYVYVLSLVSMFTPALVKHNYSCRYVMLAALLLVLVEESRRPVKLTPWRMGSILCGALLGIVVMSDFLGVTRLTR